MLFRLIREFFRRRRQRKLNVIAPPKEELDKLDLPFDWRAVVKYLNDALEQRKGYLSTTDFRSILIELAKEGFEGFALGRFKLVYLHREGWVIKLPFHPRATEQIKREMFILNRMEAAQKTYFPNTYLVDNFIIQPRYDPSPERYQKVSKEIIAIGKLYNVSDVFSENVGFDETGRWYFLDLGL